MRSRRASLPPLLAVRVRRLAALPGPRLVFTEHGRLSDAPPSPKRRPREPDAGVGRRALARSRTTSCPPDARGRAGGGCRSSERDRPRDPPTAAPAGRAARRLGLAATATRGGDDCPARPGERPRHAGRPWPWLRRTNPALRLVVIGDGPERAGLEQSARRPGAARGRALSRAPRRRARPSAAFDVYANSSTSEGVSLTILEAMAAGLPVVATRVGGTPEVVDARAAVLVPARDRRRRLAARARDAGAPMPRCDATLGGAGRARVEERFTHRPDGARLPRRVLAARAPDDVRHLRRRSRSTARSHPECRAALPAMTGALAHRGPDGDGFVDRRPRPLRPSPPGDHRSRRRRTADGQRRRHVLDRVQRRDLQPSRAAPAARGARAIGSAPSSDTEAILHAYEEYGPACVERLEGMFAFAIYDERRRELFSRAIAWARSRSSTRCSTASCTSPAR